jgi:hypothetical protein
MESSSDRFPTEVTLDEAIRLLENIRSADEDAAGRIVQLVRAESDPSIVTGISSVESDA